MNEIKDYTYNDNKISKEFNQNIKVSFNHIEIKLYLQEKIPEKYTFNDYLAMIA